MISARRVSYSLPGFGAVVALLLVTSCSDDDFSAPSVTGILLKPAAGAVKVNDTEPPGAPQETVLDVLVFGSGFDDGSQVTFMLDGLPNPKVSTNSSHYVSPDTLVANITVDVDADTVLYDVQVMTTRGKKGIGVDLFRVVLKGETVGDIPITVEFSDAEEDGVLSDSGYAYAGIFRENGSFISSAYNQDRNYYFDFPDDVSLEPGTQLPDDGYYAGYVTTRQPEEGLSADIYRMPRGTVVETIGQVYWVASVQVGSKEVEYAWVLRFGHDCSAIPQVLSDKRFCTTHQQDD